MNSIFCCLFIMIVLCINNSTAVNSCFYCESRTHRNCVDHYNKSNGTFVDCEKFLEADIPPVVRSRMSQPKKPFSKIFETKRWKRSAGIVFRCAKTEVEYKDSTIEMIRMCVPVQSNQAACPHLRQNIGSGFLMRSCHECTSDNCNLSNRIEIHYFVISVLFLTHKLIDYIIY